MSDPRRSGAVDDWRAAVAAPGGYAWWYFDATAPDGAGLVCIFLVGSVFSPGYAARCRRGERAMPAEHSAVNLALYRPDGRHHAWVMSEYPGCDLQGRVAIGRSTVEPSGPGWRITLDERQAPVRRRLRGWIDVEPQSPRWAPTWLTEGNRRHGWQVLAARAKVVAEIDGIPFTGVGYHDHNWGNGRLEDSFVRWSWARFHRLARTSVLYSVVGRGGERLALWADARDGEEGRATALTPVDEGRLALPYGMAMPRRVGGRDGDGDEHSFTPGALLEGAPFYARYRALLDGASEGVGEHLDLDRFASRWTQFLVRFKMRHEDHVPQVR